MNRGQGAFEYLMSYGWAVLVVVVLGIVLYNLGAFSPSSSPVASGFSVIQPKSWSASSSTTNASGTIYNVSIFNSGGKDLIVNASLLNITRTGCTASVSNVNVTDDSGIVLAGSFNNGIGGGTFTWGAGNLVKIGIYQFGSGCTGGSRGQGFRVKFNLPGMTDNFGIPVTDGGYLIGDYT
jgi:hypothetical protein